MLSFIARLFDLIDIVRITAEFTENAEDIASLYFLNL